MTFRHDSILAFLPFRSAIRFGLAQAIPLTPSAGCQMPFLAYLIVVATILMGMIVFSETAISPPSAISANSEVQAQKVTHKIPTKRNASSQILASAKLVKKKWRSARGTTRNTKIEHSEAKDTDNNYYARLAQEHRDRTW
jgi:hypothetical protein